MSNLHELPPAPTGKRRYSTLTLFKFFVYGSLCWSSSQFIYEDLVAASLLLDTESSASEILNFFSVSIDTICWLVLLVIFELETSILEDERLRGGLKWFLSAVSAFCYLVIVYAFTGYLGKLFMLGAATSFDAGGLCQMLNQSLVVMIDMDEYESLTASNCVTLENAGALGKVVDYPIIYAQSIYTKVIGLATAATINSAAWILVVAILQFDIVMQMRGGLSRSLLITSALLKAVLYLVLALVALYWGLVGDFVDFWDAFLWLAGFFIIELNIFKWQQETAKS
ncbi:MAG: hypothetical protein V7720_09680 [Halioglobus sp.]